MNDPGRNGASNTVPPPGNRGRLSPQRPAVSRAAAFPRGVFFFALGIALAPHLDAPPGLFLAAGAAGLAGAAKAALTNRPGVTAALLALCFCLGGLAHARARLAVHPADLSRFHAFSPLLVEGTVTGSPQPGRFTVRARRLLAPVSIAPVTGTVLVETSGRRPPLEPGDIVQLRLALEAVAPDRFPTPLARRGIHSRARIRPGELALVGRHAAWWPRAAAERLRARLGRHLARRIIDEPQATLVGALTFGLARPGRQAGDIFRRAGIYHLVVISGLHTGFFLIFLHLVLSPLALPPRPLALAQAGGLALFALLCGLATPVVRAAMMAGFYCAGRALNRAARPRHALSGAAFILLLWNPLDLFDPGWQLTFGISLGLICGMERLAPHLSRRPAAVARLAAALAVSGLAQWLAAPLSAFHFGSFSLLGFVSNLLFIPLAGAITLLGAPLLLPGPVGQLAAETAWLAATVFYHAAARLAEPAFAWREVTPGNPWYFAAYLPLVLLLLLPAAEKVTIRGGRERPPDITAAPGPPKEDQE